MGTLVVCFLRDSIFFSSVCEPLGELESLFTIIIIWRDLWFSEKLQPASLSSWQSLTCSFTFSQTFDWPEAAAPRIYFLCSLAIWKGIRFWVQLKLGHMEVYKSCSPLFGCVLLWTFDQKVLVDHKFLCLGGAQALFSGLATDCGQLTNLTQDLRCLPLQWLWDCHVDNKFRLV